MHSRLDDWHRASIVSVLEPIGVRFEFPLCFLLNNNETKICIDNEIVNLDNNIGLFNSLCRLYSSKLTNFKSLSCLFIYVCFNYYL